MWTVLARDWRELRRSGGFRFVLFLFAALALAASLVVGLLLRGAGWLNSWAAEPLLGLVLGLILYFFPFSVLLTFVSAFAGLPLTREKANGNIDTLLATSLSPGALWIGKSLAVFIPGYVLSSILTFLVLLLVNLIAVLPVRGELFFPLPLIILAFLILPLLFRGLLFLSVLVTLIADPELSLFPIFIVGFGLMIGVPAALALGVIDPASWSFALYNLYVALFIWGIVFALLPLLKKERIVLSRRGA